MQQILWNILRNAIKFTPRLGRIRIASQIRDGDFVLTCNDTGIGIEPTALRRIFVAFEQADADSHQRYGGLGLGLAIAAGIVRSHGGELAAASEGLGHGATFTLRLPAVPATEPAERPAREC